MDYRNALQLLQSKFNQDNRLGKILNPLISLEKFIFSNTRNIRPVLRDWEKRIIDFLRDYSAGCSKKLRMELILGDQAWH